MDYLLTCKYIQFLCPTLTLYRRQWHGAVLGATKWPQYLPKCDERLNKLFAGLSVQRSAQKLFTFAIGKQCVGWREDGGVETHGTDRHDGGCWTGNRAAVDG